MFFTVRHLVFLLFLVLVQIGLGFGQYDDEEEDKPKEQTQRFTAVSSLLFRPGTNYTVFFTVIPNPTNKSLQLKCVLMANSSKTILIHSDPISLRPGESGQISIPMPRNETVWRLFAWSFTEESWKDGYEYEAPHTLIFSSELQNTDGPSRKKVDLQAVFIQTDKPAYKPDDLIRIRVITMGSNDLPHLTAGVNMTITDSQGTIMKRWEQPLERPASASLPSNVSRSGNESVALFGEFQKKINGLSSYEFQLSSEPILGNWTIQVEAGNITERVDFDVQTYILPKFQVKIEAPSILHGIGEVSAAATVKASYTYGKGLQGVGNVTVTDDEGGPTRIQQIEIKDGEAIVHLKLSSSHSSYTINTIVANVTEKSTGRWQIGEATVRIYPQETYYVQWINEPPSYKPGLPLTVQLKVTGRNGFPVQDVRTNSLRVNFSSSLNLPVKETSIPLSGIATFSFVTPLEPLQSVNSEFQVLYKKSTFDFTLPAPETGTSSGILIEVVSPLKSINFVQGHSYNFTIRSNQPIQPQVFHYLLWDDAAMDVHGAQTIINNHNEPAKEFPFSLQIPKAAYTGLKIFVYFQTEHNKTKQIISTSKSINTHNYLKIRVSSPITMQAPAPAPGAGINNSTGIRIAESGISSTVTSLPDAPIEARTEEDYDDYAGDDPGFVELQESNTSSKLEVEPGEAVEIHFETYPDSTIAIRGIDQSLLLLTEQDNDLKQEAVERKRASLQSSHSELNILPPDNSSFLKAFRRLGISVLDSERVEAFSELVATSFGGDQLEEGEVGADGNDLTDASTIPQVDTRLRTKFPETWLWEEFESSSNSTTTVLSKILPDTLTSWIISGFSLNPKTGLGVASPATITGFMPFFVTLNLPYSVVKYESFDLQVIVHNYLDRDVKVFVTLFNKQTNSDSGFDFVDGRDNQRGNKTRSIRVKKDHATLTHFVITPMVIGDIPIEVKVVTEDGTAGDSMRRYLKVKPDGVRETKSQLFMFDAKTGAKNLSREAGFDVEFPERVVKGASSLQLTVVGDPMGTMTSNLGHLLQLPGGCGEQNMIRFVPNVLALHYLTATHSDAKDVMQTAKANLETGYAHQLKYRKSDGSFAVWEHQPGTTWLTSYVLRWFVEAQKYITIDNNVIRRATEFLLSRQQTDGSFLSLVAGPTYHPELCLYGCNGVALTAYITLALIKVNESSNSNLNLRDLRVAIEKGMNFISTPSVYQQDDNYITNLVAATLMAGNHPEKTRFFDKMEKGAKTSMNFKYWDMKNKTEVASGPLAIEMTSYALLAHLWKNPMSMSVLDISTFKINKWLLSQRNPQGGFISTQDTMMGLTALSEFALRTRTRFVDKDELQLSIRASRSSDSNSNDTELEVSVRRWNRLVLQEFELPASSKNVTVQARGGGPALIQMTQSWYIPIKNQFPRSVLDHFNITANMRIPDPEEPSETELTLCVNSYHTSGARDSIASIQLPTGYAFYGEDYEADSDFMKQRPENAQRFELSEGNTKMDVYYTEIKGHPPTCLSLQATQQTLVANAKNPPILVYEYLNPARSAQVAYEPAHNLTVCQICQSTRACGKEECK